MWWSLASGGRVVVRLAQVWHHEAGAGMAAVGNDHVHADSGFRAAKADVEEVMSGSRAVRAAGR
ncbi:hypothetical protein STTU_2872 [Streptomyces sp. Tu6071]|nr:hypothetical protein STTU_2872 [Streptomyces sp. Tu6071]